MNACWRNNVYLTSGLKLQRASAHYARNQQALCQQVFLRHF
jgi:hypothetical protein